jgi:hypothetical protein
MRQRRNAYEQMKTEMAISSPFVKCKKVRTANPSPHCHQIGSQHAKESDKEKERRARRKKTGTLLVKMWEVVKTVQWASRKKGYHTIFNSYRRLGTVGIFTYYENNLGRILNNITSHSSIKQNRCQPW